MAATPSDDKVVAELSVSAAPEVNPPEKAQAGRSATAGDSVAADGPAAADESVAAGEKRKASEVNAEPAVKVARVAIPEKGKVKLKRSVVERVKKLNADGALPKPIRLPVVAGILSALPESEALAVLEACHQELDPSDPDADPTEWIAWEGKRRVAALAPEAPATPEHGEEAEEETKPEPIPEVPKKVSLKRKMLNRMKGLNESEILAAPLRIGTLAGPLAALEESYALSLLDSLEEDAETIADPTAWLCMEAQKELARLAEKEQDWKAWDEWEAERAGDLYGLLSEAVLERVREINRAEVHVRPFVLAAVAGPLALLDEGKALEILKYAETDPESVEAEDPNWWLNRQCFRKAGKVMARVDMLNRFKPGKMDLLARIVATKVRPSLASISEKAALSMLEELESKALEVEDPTSWILERTEKILAECKFGKIIKEFNDSGVLPHPIDRAGQIIDLLLEAKPVIANMAINEYRRRFKSIKFPLYWFEAEIKRKTEASGKASAPWKGKGKGDGKDAGKNGKGGGKDCKGGKNGKDGKGALKGPIQPSCPPPKNLRPLNTPPNTPPQGPKSPQKPPPSLDLAGLSKETKKPVTKGASSDAAASEPRVDEPGNDADSGEEKEVDPADREAEELEAYNAMRTAFGAEVDSWLPKPEPAAKKRSAPAETDADAKGAKKSKEKPVAEINAPAKQETEESAIPAVGDGEEQSDMPLRPADIGGDDDDLQ